MALNTIPLFDQPEYSDITVSYSGRKTFCYKIILCQSSEYFKKLCGPGSHFAESKQDTVELKKDDPDAVFQLLHYVYTNDTRCGDRENDYALQLEISKVAQKYLYPTLQQIAAEKFRKLFTGMTEPEEIFDAITHVCDASDDEAVLGMADEVEQRHTLPMLNVPGFRDWVVRDRELLWMYLDKYADFKAGLDEMRLAWCPSCGGGRLLTMADFDQMPKQHRGRYAVGNHELKSVSCWISKGGLSEDFTTELYKSERPIWN